MIRFSLLVAFVFSYAVLQGQGLPAQKLLDIFAVPASKFDDWASKKKFNFLFNNKNEDTLIKHYTYQSAEKKGRLTDSVPRKILCKESKNDFTLLYQTASVAEFANLISEFVQLGFYCNQQGNPATDNLIYQRQEFTVKTFTEISDSLPFYSIQLYAKDFPDPQEVNFADDLLCFTSHEYLVHYFGKEQVKKDYYYFSGNELANCSVLFINTSRQVVFIWKDEVNKMGIDDILFGGQQKLKSAIGNNGFVAESDWRFKSGVHPGMTLYELRVLNGDDIHFHGGNSPEAGTIITGNKGKLDFYKEEIILGCVNCNNSSFLKADVVTADEALANGNIMFVLSVVLNADEKKSAQPNTPIVSK